MKSPSRQRLVAIALLLAFTMLFGSFAYAEEGSLPIPDTFIIIGNRCIDFSQYWMKDLDVTTRAGLVSQVMEDLYDEGETGTVPVYWRLNPGEPLEDLRDNLRELTPAEGQAVIDQVIAVIPGSPFALAAVKAKDANAVTVYFTDEIPDNTTKEYFAVEVGGASVDVIDLVKDEKQATLTLNSAQLRAVGSGGRLVVNDRNSDAEVVTNSTELVAALNDASVKAVYLVPGEYEGAAIPAGTHTLFTEKTATSVQVHDAIGIAVALGSSQIDSIEINNYVDSTVITDYVLYQTIDIASGSSIHALYPGAEVSFAPGQTGVDTINAGDNVQLLAPAVVAENFNTHSGTDYKGINVGFNLQDLTMDQVASMKAELYADDDTIVATNEALMSQMGAELQHSTPFIITEGTYVEEYWTLGSYDKTRPVKAVITIVDTYGRTFTAENNSLSEATASFDSLFVSQEAGIAAENFNTHSGADYKGINVGFRLANMTPDQVKSIKVELFDGDTLLATNTATSELFGLTDLQHSSPFIITDGGYAATEIYWNLDDSYDGTKPTKAVITVVDIGNNTHTAENTSLSEATADFDTLSISYAAGVVAENFNTHAGADYKGVNVGFHFENLKASQVESIKVELFDGETLLATNTAKMDMIKSLSDSTVQHSTPFIIKNNGYVEKYWILDGDYDFTKPTKAVVTVVDIAGQTYTAENTTLSQATVPFDALFISYGASVAAENFNTHSGDDYKGINVGFRLNDLDLTQVQSMQVELFSGSTKLVTNQAVMSEMWTLTDLQHSTPFIITDGGYAATEKYWTLGAYDGSLKPTKAVITVVDKGHNTYTAENTVLSEATATFDGLSISYDADVVAENFNTHAGTDYKGINVGFRLDSLLPTQVESITVELFDGSDELLATNTANQALLALSDAQHSTPFIVTPGSYVEEYWTLGTYNADKAVKPGKAVITVVDKAGDTYTVHNSSLSEATAPFEALFIAQDAGVVAENFNTHSGADYKGINVGFKLEQIQPSQLRSITVELLDAQGNVLATNEATEALFDLSDAQHSTPFIITDGGYAETEQYWTPGKYNADVAVKPATAVITVVDIGGITYTVENASLSEATADFATLFISYDADVVAENFNTHAGTDYKGVNVGFRLEDLPLSQVESIKVELFSGENLLATNTANAGLLKLTDVQHSTPFIVTEGTYEEEYWNLGNYDGTRPTRALITVVDIAGETYTAESSSLSEATVLFEYTKPVVNTDQLLGYFTIQDAIDAATKDDTILVAPGTYVGNLEIDVQGLTLKSAVQHAAVIKTVSGFDVGNGYGGVTVLAHGVTIDGFRIEQGVAQAVIHTHNSHNVTIQNNRVVGLNGINPRGIDVGYASAASDRVTIQYNDFEDLYCGVYVNQGTDLTIDHNEFADMVDGAVVFDGTWPIGDITVTNNTATDAGYLLYFFGNADSVDVDNNTLNNTELTNWGVYNSTQESYFSTIQAAIDRADDYDTIEVAAGMYDEFLAIDKSISLLGPNAGVGGYSSERVGEAILTPPVGTNLENPESNQTPVVEVTAADVTIDGFRITGDNGTEFNDYIGFNIQAGCGIKGYEDELVIKNNVFDRFTLIAVWPTRSNADVREHGGITGIEIESNYFEHIDDNSGWGIAMYLQGASGSVTNNVVKNTRTAMQVQPYSAAEGGRVEANHFETYAYGVYYNYASRGAGSWTFEDNTFAAIDPPEHIESLVSWRGVMIQTFGTEGDVNDALGAAYFVANSIDGSGASLDSPYRANLYGVQFYPNNATDAVVVLEDNTITGVNIGVQLDSGTLDLDATLSANTFATGSKVIGHRILVPQDNTIYNMRSGAEYSDIQAAVDSAEDNDTLEVTAGTYAGHVTINKPLVLKGAQFGVDARNRSGNESIISGSITVTADNVSIDGFKFQTTLENQRALEVDASQAIVKNNIFQQAQPPAGGYSYPALVSITATDVDFQQNVVEQIIDTARDPYAARLIINGDGWETAEIYNNVFVGALGIGTNSEAWVLVQGNTITNATREAIWFYPVSEPTWMTFSNNTVTAYNAGGHDDMAAIKIVSQPSEINGKRTTQDMLSFLESEFDTVNLEWMTGVHNTTQDEFYNTIQAAIDDAADGDEITVAAGTYDEAVVVNKTLTLLGANDDVDPNTEQRGEETVLTDRLTLTGDNVITVDGFKFLNETLGVNNQTAVAINGNGQYSVMNSIFERNNGADSEALATEGDLAIRGIEISAASSGSIDIQNNLFTGSAVDVYSNSSWNSAIYLNGGQQAVTIKDNVFEVSRTALNLDDFSNAITVTGNTFGSGNGTHISFGGTTPTSGSYSISGNDFAVVGAVLNLSKVDPAFRLYATGNKFDGKAPTEMSEEELFVLESLIWHKGKGGRNGFVRVLEDQVFVTTQSGTIAQAIAVAESGDTVRVAAGLYPENLTINKTLTLLGAGDDESGTILSPTSGRIITLKAGGNAEDDRLTIKGIRLANNASNGIYTDSTISHITIEDVTVTNMQSYGITIHNHAVVSDLKLNNVTVNDCSVGLRVRGSLNGLTVTDSHFDGNGEGLSSVAGEDTYLTDVAVSDTTFNLNSRKGLYLEKLSDALFEGIEVVNSGTEVGYDYSTGVDINLKFADYQNITIKDSKISGASNGAAGHGLAIKARDDGDDYAVNPATLTNVRIEGVELTDNYNGILISGSITEPVVIVKCVIENIGFELGNLSTAGVTATENWWGSEVAADIAAKVYGTVQYNPWYVDTSLTKLCTEAAVELVNATDDETEMQAVLRSNKVALGLGLSAYDNSLTEIGRLRVAVAMVAGRDYDSIQDVQDAFKNAVRVQELLVPINTASTPAGMMTAIDKNGEELGLPDSYFDWTEPYLLQVAEVVLNSRRLGGYANAEALLAVVNPVVDDLAEEANAVVEVNDAAAMAEIREALEAKAAILGLSTGDGSDYAALPEAYKNRVAQTMLAGEPYPDKTAIASAFEAAVVAEKAEADAVNVVNNATTSAEMGAALVYNAAALGLDLDDFHNLLEYYRGVVLEQLLGPEYADAAAIRVAVGAAVDTVKTESAAVAAVNAAADVAAMGAALDALGLDLTDYNTLVAYYQNEVARLMLDSVPYANKADVETAFADAVSQQMVTSAAVAAVNAAGNWQTMKVTLKDNEQALGLNMSAYDDLSSTEQNLVAAIMVAQRPANGYANHVQIQEMFTQAMAEVTGNGIAGMQALLGEEFDK